MIASFPRSVLNALDRGDPGAAEDECRSRLRVAPGDPAAKALLPVALLQQGRAQDAVPLLEELVRQQPEDSGHHANLGLALVAIDRHDAAIRVLEPAAARWPASSSIRFALGQARLQRGFARAAAADLAAVLRMNEGDTHAAALLARAWQESGERERGAQLADRILAASPADPAVLSELGLALIDANRDADAEHCLTQAIATQPNGIPQRVHLAQLFERQNRLREARSVLEPLGDQQQSDPLLRLIRGRLLRREGQLDQAAHLLRELLRDTATGPIAAEAATELGHVLDARGEVDEAFSAFTTGNEIMLEIESGLPGTGAPAADPRQWLMRQYAAAEVARWSAPVEPAPDTPIFVVGFPRSGTTLLENILDAHPALQALEEKPAVDAAMSVLEQTGPIENALAELDQEAAERARAAYWREVRRHVTPRPGTRLVDRYPLNMARLAIIQRVFPGAPVLLLVRHPCDVVLSCFMQNFRIKDGTIGFHRLSSGARIYDQLMQKWLAETAALAPRLLTLRYEDLVTDYERNVRKLTEFLQVDWHDRLLDPAAHARTRVRIHTPSYSQVIRPVHSGSVDRWRRYRHHLREILPVLEPWISHWRYGAAA